MSGWFELNKSNDSQYHFVLKAANGEILLSSKIYPLKSEARNGIGAVQTHSQSDDRYEMRLFLQNQRHFLLKTDNNQIIGMSQMYSSDTERDAGIASVKEYGGTLSIRDNS